MPFMQRKLNTDIAWTMGSFLVLAISGIVINIFIVSLRDAEALGVFNLAYTTYIIASQIAVMGLHYSVLRYTALYADDINEQGRLFFTAATAALFFGLLMFSIIFFSSSLFGELFNSISVGKAIYYAAFGLIFFPLNKVIFAYLNGLRLMKMYSIILSGRYIIVMLWIAIISASKYPFELVALGFCVAEFVTFSIALLYLYFNKLIGSCCFDIKWAKQHVIFGCKALLSGMFVEINSRVDVLLIGVLLPTRAVGIYSFVIMLIDGLYHLLATIRTNFNPVLVGVLRDGQWSKAKDLLNKSRTYIYPITIFLALGILIAFWLFVTFITPNKGLSEGLNALLILLVGLTIISAYIPFDNLMLVSGNPSFQTLQHMSSILSNVTLNLILVPIFGIEGAAFATACSYVVGIIVLFCFVRRFLSWNIFNNFVES